ncbi:MAG TPA: hemerythrin domain-containing protein [Acidimicrobiales bacterium]|nr:hemerythrin domain-containing protein [Acidimicrobiales bacterium]
MDDHAVMADLAYRVGRALESADPDTARMLMGELAGRFRRHSLQEEAGLFAELAAAGDVCDAGSELERLMSQHAQLRGLLASDELVLQPERLRAVLADLADHAEAEEDDLFPYALQRLPAPSWDRINQAEAGGGS